jgi:putative peptide zinc metalloprotease protein
MMADSTTVILRPLSIRSEGDSWVIGRAETGNFVIVPPVARRVIALLSAGGTIGDVARALAEETGTAFTVAPFVASLDDLGFVAAINGVPRQDSGLVQPSLPWLHPQAVRWLLKPATWWAAALIIVAAVATVITDPALVPGYHGLVWSQHPGIVLAVDAAIGWTIACLHELGHLVTARAAGVPAQVRLGTRLQFLVLQTDVSGIWAAPRSTRMTVYCAGMVVNLLVASGCVLILRFAGLGGLTRLLLIAAELEALLSVPLEFLVYMRTDVYFIVQDLAGCANLYAEGAAHLRYLWQCVIRRGARSVADPAVVLPRRERQAVRAYSFLLLSGTVVTVAAAFLVTLPAAFALIARAVSELTDPATASRIDAAAALAVLGSVQTLWLRAWSRRHVGQLADFLRTARRRVTGGGKRHAAS